MNKDFTSEAEVIKALGHPIRLNIMCCISSEECNQKHLLERLGLPQAIISQHLAILKHAGIISGKKIGHEVHYSVIHPLAKRIIQLLE